MLSLHQVNIGNLPLVASEMLGITEFAGGVFCTIIFLIAVELPLTIYVKRLGMIHLLTAFLIVCFGVAVGWIADWFLLMFALFGGLVFMNWIGKYAR